MSISFSHVKVVLLILLSMTAYSAHSQPEKEEPLHIIDQATQQLASFTESDHWQSVASLTGTAKAIIILPQGGQVGFLLGAQWGQGVLLARRGDKWSAPVFIKLNSAMFGILAGAQSVNGVGVILNDDIITHLQSKPISFGATADLTIVKGVSGKVVGGTSGIGALMVSENKGLYFGGSMDSFQLRLDSTLNNAFYGEQMDYFEVLNDVDGLKYPQADKLRGNLTSIAVQAIYNPLLVTK